MNATLCLASKLWNSRPDLLQSMLKRSSVRSALPRSSDLGAGQLGEGENRWPWCRLLFYAYLCLAVVRFLFASYVISTGKRMEIAQWDVLMAIGIEMKLINFNTGILCAPLTLFCIYYDYTVYLKRYNSIIHLLYDAVVRNSADFFTLNPAFKPDIKVRAPLTSVKSLRRSFSLFTKPPVNLKIKWAAPSLPYYPYLDDQIRLRSLLVNWGLQFYIALFLFCTSKSENATHA